jgi:ATP-binding cassette subfamily F protein uup
MALISCQNLHVSWGGRALLDDVGLQIEGGERIGLVGRNGEGKSTLLSVLTGALIPDSGEVIVETGIRIALLEQKVPGGMAGTVEDVVRTGLMGHEDRDHSIQRLCSLLKVDPAKEFSALSGGLKRRALIARALASEPDVLLLDEPTNHLDLGSIEWLENFLLRFKASLLFVTHDRAFLQNLSTRILELDRGRLTSWSCDYPTYLSRKEELLSNQEKEWTLFDKTLAKEEEWIRQGIKARRTRNEGRVRALKELRTQRAARRERVGQVRLSIQQAERSWSKVITTRELSFGYPDTPIVEKLSTTIVRGDRVGLMGPNGCGKTTLLNLLLGQLEPDAGHVKHGGSLEIAHFDQHRETLEEDKSIADNVSSGSHVTLDGQERHIMTYLQDFLFSPNQARQPVSTLSGGERNRLLLARLFTRPANVLVLDEPTNDLDLETLELLESRLLDYNGTVLVVSHDRSFLDNLCTSTLVFEGKGQVKEYVGGYSDWRRVVERQDSSDPAPAKGKKKSPASPRPRTGDAGKPKRLNFNERREWEGLPGRIEELEKELVLLHERMGAPDFFKKDPEEIRKATEDSRRLPGEIEALFSRWAELDERNGEEG